MFTIYAYLMQYCGNTLKTSQPFIKRTLLCEYS